MLKLNVMRVPVALTAVLALGACGGLLDSKQPAAQTWWLEPLDEPATTDDRPRHSLQLELAVAPGLDSNRIMALDSKARFSPYAGSQWVEDLPELLEFLLGRSLVASGKFVGVDDYIPASLHSTCHLRIQVLAFHGHLDESAQTSSVEVALEGRYRCGEAARSVKARASVAVQGNHMPEIVAAFQHALNKVQRELLGQL